MRNRILWIIATVIMFIGSAALIYYYLNANGYLTPVKESQATTTYAEFTYPSLGEEIILEDLEAHDPEVSEETEPYVSPIDFDELKAVNPDIIGWLYMDEPALSLPILRNSTDDSFYLYHDAAGEYNREGSLYVEATYNSDDFTDPCTVIYGHRMSNGAMFGTMQATLSEQGFFDDCHYVVIYTPECSHIYQICATFPFDNSHLLYHNNFSDQETFESFIDQVWSLSGVEVNLIDEVKPEPNDNILLLSSCLWGDRTRRYIVMAKEL